MQMNADPCDTHSATAAALFEDRAVAHFLDFTRERDVEIKLFPCQPSWSGPPTVTVRLPTIEAGDMLGAEALAAALSRGSGVEIMVPVGGRMLPCGLQSCGPFDGNEITLELRYLG